MSMRLVIVFEYLGLEIGRKKIGNCSPNSTGRTESKLREVEEERERDGVKQGFGEVRTRKLPGLWIT